MQGDFERYAVFWVPSRSDALARFGSSWMGWCAETGERRPRHAALGLSGDIPAATRDVSRHGFHGLLRAPFRLRQGRSRWAVEIALRSVADELDAVALPRFSLAVIGGQVSLVPESPCRALSGVVDQVEQALAAIEAHPAPGSSRSAPTQSSVGEQISQLPAGAAHRFRMPLTDRMDLGSAFRVRDELEPRLAPILSQSRRLADLALMGDPGGGRTFRVLQRFELRETQARRPSSALPVLGPLNLVDAPGAKPVLADIAV